MRIPFDHRVRTEPDAAPRPSWGAVVRDGRAVPYFMCACGKRGALTDHEVDDGGSVTPSVHHEECGFHEHVQLADWPGADALRLGPLLN